MPNIMGFLELVFYSIVFFLPAYVANAMPVIISGLKIFPSLAKPINKKLFGKNKTYRGFITGITGAMLISPIQNLLGFSYDNLILLAFLLGLGALLGDLIKSFIKRKIGKKSGRSWPVFDQIDYVIGALLFSSIIFPQSLSVIIVLIVISPLFSILANIIAYNLKIKKVWW
ncbi:CDP-2,3-bis-(O-geranylgeranyl)-sn-glycerol synthase [bacterium]|nr:CDP-2,3-bis-(O-geranylgeranyl)-sn-glycerol synthase [bacterium]